MQDVEQHRATGSRIGESRPVSYEVANDPHDVRQPGFRCFAGGFRNHARINVDGDDSPCNSLCRWDRKRPVSTAEVDYITARTRAV
jgi:hypothetical protein